MNKDQAKGTMKEIGGKVQQAAGDLTGNDAQKIKGAATELEGKVQKKVGDVKQALDDADKDSKQH
jgi:uncharacterized protein YjbJ (UPF0337 family)